MIVGVSLEVLAKNLSIDIKTALYYGYLVCETLRDYQDEVFLDGTILVDETFVRIIDRKYRLYIVDRKGIRGISFNHLCVITLINLEGITIAKLSSRGNPSPQKFIDLCKNNVG